jgi:DNA polymerase IV (DinB-like DNA polymerase)
MISLHLRAQKLLLWTTDIFVIKRDAMWLLAEFIGRQKIGLVGVGFSRIRERDSRQTLITDF